MDFISLLIYLDMALDKLPVEQVFISSVNVTDEREAHSKHWIAVYTRPRSEKKLPNILID